MVTKMVVIQNQSAYQHPLTLAVSVAEADYNCLMTRNFQVLLFQDLLNSR